VCVLTACAVQVQHREREASPASARTAAEGLLAHGAAAWNRGDLNEFVADYTPDATFVTARRVVRGRANIRGLYEARFRPGAQRDSLRFEDLEVDAVAPDGIAMIAYYVLVRGDSVTSRGPTSLLLRRVSGRWYIAHDHSS
jgi:uncharacterized protein (TIGR02246 family)